MRAAALATLGAAVLSASAPAVTLRASGPPSGSSLVQRLGPPGGDVAVLRSGPTAGSGLWAAVDGGGVFRSVDQGASWSDRTGPSMDRQVLSLTLAPPAAGGLLAGTRNGAVWRSLDDGASWESIGDGLPASAVLDLAMLPDGRIGVGLAGGGVWLGSGDPVVWSWASSGLSSPVVNTLAADPGNALRLWAGTATAGVFRSIDGGASWSAAGTETSGLGIRDLELDPVSGRLWAATVGQGVARSDDGGLVWTWTSAGLPSTDVYGLHHDGLDLWAATAAGVARSADQGASWVPVGAAATWDGVDEPLVVRSVLATTQVALAGTAGAGVWRRATSSSSPWAPSNEGLEGSFVLATLAPADARSLSAGRGAAGAGWVVAGSALGVQVQAADGSWQPESSGLPSPRTTSLSAAEGFIFVGTSGAGVYRRPDLLASSWQPANATISSSFVRDLQVAGPILLAATDSGLVRSLDQGVNWTPVIVDADLRAVSVGGPRWFAVERLGSVWKSDDQGGSWQAFGSLPDFTFVVEVRDDEVLVGAETGLWCSGTAVIDWRRCGLDGRRIRTLAAHDDQFWAGTLDAGLWRSPSPGSSWHQVDDLPADLAVYALESAGDRLGIATFGRGLLGLLSATVFRDGFESGDASAWSRRVP